MELECISRIREKKPTIYESVMQDLTAQRWIFDKAKRSLANKEETGTWELSDAKSLPLS